MVAKIKSGKSLRGALNYNENKVKQGKATLIHAPGYLKDPADINFYDKLYRLTDLTARNERTKTNTVHISLNFANGENLSNDLLQKISEDYMKGIGFENQPFLVYRHTDAGHPHIHIVSTNIKASGERISLHHLGQDKSEKTRKAIEAKYQLIKAEDRPQQKPEKASKVEYGQGETKRQLTNIVNQVIREYKFTSLPEFNALLQQYHVVADAGAKDSRMQAHDGLLYWISNEKGEKLGVPIKASSIYGKPTIKNLRERFRLNDALRKQHKAGLMQKIDTALRQTKKPDFQKQLDRQQVQVIFRSNEQGRLYGVTYIDQQSKCVFNGSDLGKAYSANALSAQFQTEVKAATAQTIAAHSEPTIESANNELLDILFQPESQDIAALNKFKKKRKRQNH